MASTGCNINVSGNDCNLAASLGVILLLYFPIIDVCTIATSAGNVSGFLHRIPDCLNCMRVS